MYKLQTYWNLFINDCFIIIIIIINAEIKHKGHTKKVELVTQLIFYSRDFFNHTLIAVNIHFV